MKASQLDIDIGLETLLCLFSKKPFEAQATATFMIYLLGAMAAMYVLKPRTLFNVFGGKSTEMNDRLVQMYGLGVAGAITQMYCLIVLEDAMDVLSASRIAATPALIEFMLNFSSNPGFRSQGLEMGLVVTALSMYTTTQERIAVPAAKLFSMFWLGNAVYLITSPEKAKNLWFQKGVAWDPTTKLMARMIAFNAFAKHGLTLLLLVFRMDRLTAFALAYSSWCFKLMLLHFVTGDTQKAGLDARLVNFWIIVHGYVVLITLFH